VTSPRIPENPVPPGKSNLRWIAGIGLAVVIVAVILLRYPVGVLKPHAEPSPASSAGSAAPAPEFLLEAVGGGSTGPQVYRGKVVILNFWATWCPPCKREIPDFISLQNQYGEKGVQILGVALDDPALVKEFCLSRGINYPVVYGTDEVVRLYGGISGIPTTYVIDRNGAIVRRYEGLRSREVFEQDVRQLLLL
jgi:thiol-disulfide isomerase/thioredoxin